MQQKTPQICCATYALESHKFTSDSRIDLPPIELNIQKSEHSKKREIFCKFSLLLSGVVPILHLTKY